MDKSTLSNYGWIVIVTLVLAVMLALATPFGTYVGKGASNVIKTFVQSSDKAIDEDSIDTQSQNWDDYLYDNTKTNYTIEEIEQDPSLYAIGKNKPEYVVAKLNEDRTVVNITANGTNSDGIMMDWPDGDSPFLEITTIETVYVRKYVKNIGAVAFTELPELTTVIFTESLDTIGELAFAYCDKLTEIKFPSTLRTIENEAFFWCKKLTKVTFNNGLQTIGNSTFASCSSLKEGILPETVTSLGKRAFQNSTLSSINVTDKITKIGVAAFSGCSNLTEYKLPSSFTSIPDELYKGTAITAVTFAETIESIGASAFENCAKIETLEIPTTLKAIGASAFAGCDGLKSVKVNTIMPMAITDDVFSAVAYENATLTVPMGYAATYATATGWKNFKNVSEFAIPVAVGDTFFVGNVAYSITECGETGNKVVVTYFPVESVSDNNIKAANKAGYVGDVVVPATVSYQNIEFTVDGVTAQVFMGAEEMTSIKFNCPLTTIPERAMFSCKKLATVEIPSTVTSIEAKAFEQCQALGAITLPQGLLSIGSRAFYYCKVLENVVIPATVTSLGDYAFYECKGLISVLIADSVTSIGGFAFDGCTHLESIIIPDSVTTIGSSAFNGCTALTKIDWNAKNVADFSPSDDIFYNAGSTGTGIDVVFGAGGCFRCSVPEVGSRQRFL